MWAWQIGGPPYGNDKPISIQQCETYRVIHRECVRVRSESVVDKLCPRIEYRFGRNVRFIVVVLQLQKILMGCIITKIPGATAVYPSVYKVKLGGRDMPGLYRGFGHPAAARAVWISVIAVQVVLLAGEHCPHKFIIFDTTTPGVTDGVSGKFEVTRGGLGTNRLPSAKVAYVSVNTTSVPTTTVPG